MCTRAVAVTCRSGGSSGGKPALSLTASLTQQPGSGHINPQPLQQQQLPYLQLHHHHHQEQGMHHGSPDEPTLSLRLEAGPLTVWACQSAFHRMQAAVLPLRELAGQAPAAASAAAKPQAALGTGPQGPTPALDMSVSSPHICLVARVPKAGQGGSAAHDTTTVGYAAVEVLGASCSFLSASSRDAPVPSHTALSSPASILQVCAWVLLKQAAAALSCTDALAHVE